MNKIELIKTHKTKIITAILTVCFVGSCTSNCSHKNELRLNAVQDAAQKSLIIELNEMNDSLRNEIKLRDVIIEQKQSNVESLERTAKRNIVNVVKIDTTKLK